MAVITFFGNVLELNEIADETLRHRPTAGQNNAAIARRFQMMALGEDQCARLFSMMHEVEIKDISDVN